MFYALIFIAILAVCCLGSYGLGYSRRDAVTKTREKAYERMSQEVDSQDAELLELRRSNTVYLKALRHIASGSDRIPEITASIALNDN